MAKDIERQDALRLASRVLDRPNADPDDDLAMLSRQLLRGQETIDRLRAAIPDLLAACEAARAYGSQGDTDDGFSVSEIIRAAIAKARGE